MSHLQQFISGFAICLPLAILAIGIAPALGLLDIPKGRHLHARPVAKVGGLALIGTLLVRMLLNGIKPHMGTLELAAILVMAILGLLDDLFDLPAHRKAAIGAAVAAILAYCGARQLASAGVDLSLLGMSIGTDAVVLFVLLFLMYLALPNAFNLIDGANGLAMGFGLIVIGSLWLAGYPHQELAGALFATLILNWPKPRLFLGDCGSLSLGLLLVIMVMSGVGWRDPNMVLWIFAYPIIDVTMVVLIRFSQGRRLTQGDRSHMHHQIRDRWPALARWKAPWLWLLAAMCASASYLQGPWRVVPLLGLGLLLAHAISFVVMSVGSGKAAKGISLETQTSGSDS